MDISIQNHLNKYFQLARNYFSEKEYALATFSSLTLIEECGKILYLRDADLNNEEERRGALNHSQKYITALVNLIEQSKGFNTLPDNLKIDVFYWLSSEQIRGMRNDSIYLRFNRNGRLTSPDQRANADTTAILVYIAGLAVAELKDYVSIDEKWAKFIKQTAERFREMYIKC